MSNYIKAQSWSRANIEDSTWYAQTDEDMIAICDNENISFGDKIYVIESKQIYIIGADLSPYEM